MVGKKISIGNNVLISHDVDIFDHQTHPIDPLERQEHYKEILGLKATSQEPNWNAKEVIIKDNAWICAKVIILSGVIIGESAIVAAGSVVTKNVEDWTIVAGNPAKAIKRIPH